jgi:hypothetical protein
MTHDELKQAISTIKVANDDVILFRFKETMLPDNVQYTFQTLQASFPDNLVIGLADDVDVLVNNPADSIDMLEKMIAKIKLVHPEVTKPKIIT